jgi:hypothetical protein
MTMIGMDVEVEVKWRECNLSGNKLATVSWSYLDHRGGLDRIRNRFSGLHT